MKNQDENKIGTIAKLGQTVKSCQNLLKELQAWL